MTAKEDRERKRASAAKQRASARKKRVAEAHKLFDEGNATPTIAHILGVTADRVEEYLAEEP